MKLYVLMGQRHEQYEGQYAPEALDIIDEYTYDENPKWIFDKKEIHENTDEFESVAIITLEVDTNDIMKRLRPDTQPLSTKVVD